MYISQGYIDVIKMTPKLNVTVNTEIIFCIFAHYCIHFQKVTLLYKISGAPCVDILAVFIQPTFYLFTLYLY